MAIKYMNEFILFLLLGILLYYYLGNRIREGVQAEKMPKVPTPKIPTTMPALSVNSPAAEAVPVGSASKEPTPANAPAPEAAPEAAQAGSAPEGPTPDDALKAAGLSPSPHKTYAAPEPSESSASLTDTTQEGWNSGIKFKNQKSMIHNIGSIEAKECLKKCLEDGNCKSADFIEKGGRCILYKANCIDTPSQCGVADGISHWMKPVSKVIHDPNYLRVCEGGKEFWWFPRYDKEFVGKIGSDKACKKVCDDSDKCDMWLMSETGSCYKGKLRDKNLRVSCARPGWGKMYGQVKANKEVSVFNERSGKKMKFSGLEADDAQRLCSKYNLQQKNPYDEVKALNRKCKEGGCNLSWKSTGPWKDECFIPDKSRWTCCAKRIDPPAPRPPPPPPPPEEVDQYNLIPTPEAQPTKAIGILNKISDHLASLTPDFKSGEEDLPVEMKVNVDTIPIFDGIDDAKIKTEASKEGFLGGRSDLNNAYELREGLMTEKPLGPAEIYLDKINSYLIKRNFPLTERTETEVKFNLNQNNKKSRKELKMDIIQKLSQKAGIIRDSNERKRKKAAEEYARKNPTKIIERTEGFDNKKCKAMGGRDDVGFVQCVRRGPPLDFSNFYDETYNFS